MTENGNATLTPQHAPGLLHPGTIAMCSCVMSYSWHIVRTARAWTVVAGKVKVFQKVARTPMPERPIPGHCLALSIKLETGYKTT
jgi:hypothetical protein